MPEQINAKIAVYNDANSDNARIVTMQIFKGAPCFSSE